MNQQRTRILLVDDTASLARTYETYLKTCGYDVRCAYTGRDAIEDLSRYGADLVLLDMDLPDCSGLDVMRDAGALPARTPIVVITGTATPEVRSEAVRRGARDVLTKPVSMDQLCKAVAREVSNAQSRGHITNNGENMERPTMPHDLAGIQPTAEIAAADDPGPQHTNARSATPVSFGGFIGTSPVMIRLYEHIQNAAKSHATVFVTGESGTGKEVCAEAIHRNSPRANKPFVPLNCAAIPRDLLESELFGHVRGAFTGAITDRDGAARLADGGTLFLDEIGDMDPNMQTKLLRFLQDGTFQRVGGSRLESVDVRIICATNRNPADEVRQGRFREDLFYRLHVLPIVMPPLRQRGEDVIDIAQTLLLRYAAEERKSFRAFDARAEDAMRHYPWPGNIRQLQNVVRNIVVMHDGPLVRADMLPSSLLSGAETQTARPATGGPMTLGALTGAGGANATIRPLHQVEREVIEAAIAQCNGNIPRAAALLDISPSTIYRKRAAWEQGLKD